MPCLLLLLFLFAQGEKKHCPSIKASKKQTLILGTPKLSVTLSGAASPNSHTDSPLCTIFLSIYLRTPIFPKETQFSSSFRAMPAALLQAGGGQLQSDLRSHRMGKWGSHGKRGSVLAKRSWWREEVQEEGAEQSDLPKARSIWAVLQATFSFLDPRQRLSCQSRSPHCSPHSKMLGTMKASCQPGKSPPGADT